MAFLWHVVTSICFYIPWLLMAAAAGMVFSKHRKSRPALLEVLGATAYFLLAGAQWAIIGILTWLNATLEVRNPINTIFNFLLVVAMLIFAIGFCWEKFQQWRLPADNEKPADPAASVVTATAVPSP